jgi:hypothetical protein
MMLLTQPLGTSSFFCLKKGESEPPLFNPNNFNCFGTWFPLSLINLEIYVDMLVHRERVTLKGKEHLSSEEITTVSLDHQLLWD